MNTHLGVSNLLTTGTVTASAETVGFEAVYAYETDLTDQWKPGAAPATLIVDNTIATPISYIGLTHIGVSSVTLEGSTDGITYVPITVISSPAKVSMTMFTEVSYRYYKLTFAGLSTMAILHVGIGAYLKIEGYLTAPFTPFALSGEYDITGAVTRGALPLGRSVRLTEYPWSMNFQMIQPEWAMGTWAAIRETLITTPFYLLWDSINYPADALFANLSGPPKSPYGTTVDMTLDMTGRGYR